MVIILEEDIKNFGHRPPDPHLPARIRGKFGEFGENLARSGLLKILENGSKKFIQTYFL